MSQSIGNEEPFPKEYFPSLREHFLCVVCFGVLADFRWENTTTTPTARVKQDDVSGNRTDTRKWESCTN
jgi:hypothetical protein